MTTMFTINHRVVPDERDQAILAQRLNELDSKRGIRCGDYVVFADGVTRRVSYIWPRDVQTSDGGSFHLGKGYVSFSGSLYVPVLTNTLTLTDEKREGDVWFFHHDHARAHHGVGATIPFRVYTCSLPAPTH